MHLGNGAITPECAAITYGAAAAGLGLAAMVARREHVTREQLGMAAGLGAMVLAAQAINVPLPAGTSVHLVGGALLAWVLGPGLGSLTMALVLAIQALVLGDGGLMALGANICNMALIPAGMVAAFRRPQCVNWRVSWKPALIAAISVPLAAVCIVGQVALFRGGAELDALPDFAARMIAAHLAIGLVEGGLTLLFVPFLAWMAEPRPWRLRIAALAALLLVVALPFSSTLPDGYQAAAQRSGMSFLLAER